MWVHKKRPVVRQQLLEREPEWRTAPEFWRRTAEAIDEVEGSALFHSGIAHGVARRWRRVHVVLGIPAAVLAALAAGAGFADQPAVAGGLAAAASAMAALQTFLRPSERARDARTRALALDDLARQACVDRRVELRELLHEAVVEDAADIAPLPHLMRRREARRFHDRGRALRADVTRQHAALLAGSDGSS